MYYEVSFVHKYGISDTNGPVLVMNFFWWPESPAHSLLLQEQDHSCATSWVQPGTFRRGHHQYLLCFDDADTQNYVTPEYSAHVKEDLERWQIQPCTKLILK